MFPLISMPSDIRLSSVRLMRILKSDRDTLESWGVGQNLKSISNFGKCTCWCPCVSRMLESNEIKGTLTRNGINQLQVLASRFLEKSHLKYLSESSFLKILTSYIFFTETSSWNVTIDSDSDPHDFNEVFL